MKTAGRLILFVMSIAAIAFAKDKDSEKKPKVKESSAELVIKASPGFCLKGQLGQNKKVELWRLTDNPYEKNHTGYFTEYCWSPDGRYLAVSEGNDDGAVLDLLENQKLKLPGGKPFWANKSNLAIFLSGSKLCMFDPAAPDKITVINENVSARMSDTDCNDEYVYLWGGDDGMIRYRLQENAEKELCHGIIGNKVVPNPFHPVIGIKITKGESGGLWSNLDGSEVKWMNPPIMRHHSGWLGSGEYFIDGDGIVRGRKWNEPYPGNLHLLSYVEIGDANGLGFSGRWVVGGGNGGRRPINIADLRSGDGYTFLWPFSAVALPKGSGDQSGYYDSEPKGSPDGTKINFSSTCDLMTTPYTFAAEKQNGASIKVISTEGFPKSGYLARRGGNINGCGVISYKSKTGTSFEGVTLGEYGTENFPLDKGDWITAWEPRLIPEKEFNPPKKSLSKALAELVPEGSPLLRQRALQIYIAVVRSPDRPWLRENGSVVELIPGENHWETRGYIIFRNGEKLNEDPIFPGTVFKLPKAGSYTAVAVEWSGLRSEPCKELAVSGPAELTILKEAPADFAWTRESWFADGKPADKTSALKAKRADMEEIHVYDGVIAKSSYLNGQISSKFDLNIQGAAIRRIFYKDGILEKREIYSDAGELKTRELFDKDGYIYEQMCDFKNNKPAMHWFYEKGEAVKLKTEIEEPRSAPKGPGTYQKQGSDWVKVN